MTKGQRDNVRFPSGGTECAAWHYQGNTGGCVVMAGGFGVPKEPGTDAFAARFHAAGLSVLAFDYRGLGQSGGHPRNVQRLRWQLADWQAAIDFAAALPEVDPTRIAIWGFSLSGGHVLRVAARNPRIAAAIAQNPTADGRAATRNAFRHQTLGAFLHLGNEAVLDMLGGVIGRPPRLVPLAGEPGTVALLTTPDARDGNRALNPDNRYPDWVQSVAARSTLPLGSYRPGRDASRIRCPLLVVVADDDMSALAAPAVEVARQAPTAELVQLKGNHYAPFLTAHEEAVTHELQFLRRHLSADRESTLVSHLRAETRPL